MSDTSDTNDTEKKPLRLKRPGKLELKKTVDAGTVKQSFSHGRSKMVTVEVKKKRTYAQDSSGKMAQVREGMQPAPEAGPAPFAPSKDDNLTESEREARAKALEGAKVRAVEDEKRKVEEEVRVAEQADLRAQEEAEAAKREAEEAALRAAEEAAKPVASAPEPAPAPKAPKKEPAPAREDAKKSKKAKKGKGGE